MFRLVYYQGLQWLVRLKGLGREFQAAGYMIVCNYLTGPKPKETKVETFRIDYLIRTPKVEKLSLQPIRQGDTIRDCFADPCIRPGRGLGCHKCGV